MKKCIHFYDITAIKNLKPIAPVFLIDLSVFDCFIIFPCPQPYFTAPRTQGQKRFISPFSQFVKSDERWRRYFLILFSSSFSLPNSVAQPAAADPKTDPETVKKERKTGFYCFTAHY